MPKAYCYARASHDAQYARKAEGVEFCNTVDRQIEAAQRYWEYNLKPHGVEWGGAEADPEAVSAYKTPFMDRPAAQRLLAKLQPGDHLLFDKIDRMWRKMRDYTRIDEYLERNNITMHIINLMGATIVKGTPMGDMVINILVALAQMESQTISDRIKATVKWRKERGLPTQRKHLGFVNNGATNNRYMVADLAERAIMQEVVRLRDGGMKWWEISDELERRICQRDGKRYRELSSTRVRKCAAYREITWSDCEMMYAAEKRLQKQELEMAQKVS